MRKLHNPTDKDIHFPYGRDKIVVPAGETVMLDDAIAHHGLIEIKNELVDPDLEEVEKPAEKKDYSEMSWGEVRTLAAERGVYKVGMNREDIENALEGL